MYTSQAVKRTLNQIKNSITKRYKVVSTKVGRFIDKRPLRSFFIVLATLLALIVIGHFLPKPTPEVIKQDNVKAVEIYRIGSAPKITVSGQIKKSGVIQITAQTSGIISKIYNFEGTQVKKGTRLLDIASNYYGGNAASVSRQIAQEQNNLVSQTYQPQKDLIQKQKELAQKADDNSDQLRDITSQSNSETSNIISLNETILSTIDQNIATLQLDPVTNAEFILTAQQLKSQYLSATNQARASLRSSQFQSSADKPPAQISDLTREVAIKQLEIQEKQLDINKEISKLSLSLAQVNEGMFYPIAPFSGTIQRVFVKEFEAVSPGTPLMILSQTAEDDPITAIVYVSKDVAQAVSRLEPSILHIGDKAYPVQPTFISTEAVSGSLYAIYYPIPDEYNSDLTNEGYISVEVPIGYPDSGTAAPYVPIDAVYQTRTTSYLYVVEDGVARSKEVTLGEVFGRFVEIRSGISGSSQIIVNRNVIDGDKVTSSH